jgi:hypothetical protein
MKHDPKAPGKNGKKKSLREDLSEFQEIMQVLPALLGAKEAVPKELMDDPGEDSQDDDLGFLRSLARLPGGILKSGLLADVVKAAGELDLDEMPENSDPSSEWVEKVMERFQGLSSKYHLDKLAPKSGEQPSEGSGSTAGSDLALKDASGETVVPLKTVQEVFGVMDILNALNEDEVLQFSSRLSRFPMLGLEHPAGRKIYEAVPRLPFVTLKDIDVYRARVRNEGQTRPFTEAEMYDPPYGRASHGRFNFIGENVLYTCTDPKVAVEEVRPPEGRTVDVISWRLVQEIKCLDVSNRDIPLFRQCMQEADSATVYKPEYLLPNYVAQCCRAHNISAIRYSSAMDPSVHNIIFLEFLKSWFDRSRVLPNYIS